MTIEANHWDYPQPFTVQMQITDDNIDGLDHTNNVVYVKWCEQVAWAHSIALGLDLNSYRDLNRAMAITRAQYQYLRASHLGQTIVAGTWITSWDKKLTMERHFQIIRVEDSATLLRGQLRFACIDLTTGRPRRMPQAFLDGYGAAVLSESGGSVPVALL